ncbi:MAG: hypothetical protein JKY63_03560 [Rhodobiaceae bacterium]|nr:hypothetical protein [Rhodobiaceae bacterium]
MPVKVATPTITTPNIAEKAPGKYAIFLQSGGWQLIAESPSGGCSAHEFRVPVDTPYKESIRQVIAGTFEQVEYVDTALSAEELVSGGYAGQVTIIQSGADADFYMQARFLSSYLVTSEVRVNTVTAINLVGDAQMQFASAAHGKSDAELYMDCTAIGDIVGRAAQDAIQKLVNSMATQLQAAVLMPQS